ncbi:replication protein P [Cellvibrio japonicus]|uniref:replication protein P n=1 Tax=Cellvibrio japonicus TaxID=155077 RepID=UPI000A065A66|nr:replication protein P [Cellvibrio japonicus]
MQDSHSLIHQAEQEIAALHSNSTTAAGQAEATRASPPPSDAHVDAINQVFALFRINYHNQYYSAFSQLELLNQAKRLWLNSLAQFSPEAILRGAKKVIEESEYLPTLNRMIRACQGSPEEFGLPDAHRAYVEACQAPSPKAAYTWSHPAVYHAGCASDWYFLASNSEKTAFPIFERHYLRLCERVINGEELPAPNAPVLPQTIETPLSREENLKRMEALRKQLDL